ncbi:hypothetical protein [Streptomyces sp. NPDC006739]|uniref:hypothetical protein n=1 Tax=Streptomyces sp. NPDC006739 TaxID=3364763 RepID=UPI0036BBD71A
MPTKPPMRVFIATVADGERVDGTDVRAPRAHRVDAAYFQTDGLFTTFKDSDNQAVFMARNDVLTSVARVPSGAAFSARVELSKDFGDLGDLLCVADEKGHAQGRILQAEKDPNGRTYGYGYDIRVSTIAQHGQVVGPDDDSAPGPTRTTERR